MARLDYSADDWDLPGLGIDSLEQQRQAAALVRRNPALVMPSSGVETPKPQPQQPATMPTVPVTGQMPDSYKTMQMINERMNQQPDATALQNVARERGQRSNRDVMLGLALQAKGGATLNPAGGHILQNALKESGDYEIPGGWGTVTSEGNVAWNPAKQQEADLARLTTMYGIQQHGEAATDQMQQRQDIASSHDATMKEIAQERNATSAAASAAAAEGRGEARDARADQQRWRGEDNMRNHFDSITKDTRDVLNTARYVKTLPADGKLNAVQQQSLIVLLNKFQDPGSVVREGEFDRVASAQGLLQRWGNVPEKLMSGKPLPPEMVRDVQAAIAAFTQSAENTMYGYADDYVRAAKSRQYDPDQVVTDLRWHHRPASGGGGAAPAAGAAGATPGVTVREVTPQRRATDPVPDEPPPGAVRRKGQPR